MKKPIKVFYSILTGRFYASNQYRPDGEDKYVITGDKYDVTDDIGMAINRYKIKFGKTIK